MSTSRSSATPKKRVVKAKTPTVKKTDARGRTEKQTPSLTLTPEERWRMVAVAAYHIAEKRGFSPGNPLDDWLNAEREVESLLGVQPGK
ncbi:MAG: DUF2934 domain-containing protein [Gammaproteobacteria bacterium]|nr:DUF2934 domain-containing protein [Gammaproteobacteria bacterium]MBA3732626.1 DUF2934 domain-containing protein [Gammaproteobacteria bacterium]